MVCWQESEARLCFIFLSLWYHHQTGLFEKELCAIASNAKTHELCPRGKNTVLPCDFG